MAVEPAASRISPRATLWMLASVFAGTLELVLVHALGPGWAAPLQLLWRQGVALLLLLPLVLRDPVAVLRVSRPGIMLFRSGAAMLALLLQIYAFSHLPIGTANALLFTRPLWIVLLAALALGERITVRLIGAVLLGFAGALVVAAPGEAAGPALAQAASLAAALLFAASFVSIKSMTADNRTTTILFYGMVFGLAIAVVPAVLAWRTPGLHAAALLAGLGVTSLLSFATMAKALRLSQAGALVALDYLRLPLGAVLGFALFGERPGLTVVVGSAMIVAASLLLTGPGRRRGAAGAG